MPGLRIHPTPPPLALIHACTLGDQMEVTRLLVEEGVDVNTQTPNGTTPAHIAASMGYDSLLKELARHNVDLNIQENQDAGGFTPLHYAVEKGLAPTVALLLELGADPNIGTNDEAKARGDTGSTLGFTPLHVAARSGQADMVQLLLSRPDTDSDKRDADGNNASYWAQQLQHDAVLRLPDMPPPAIWSFDERRAVMDAARAAMAAGKSEAKKGKKKGKKGGKKKGKKKKKK